MKVRLEQNGKRDTIEEEWMNVRNAIIQTTDIAIERKQRRNRKDWFDQEYKLTGEGEEGGKGNLVKN